MFTRSEKESLRSAQDTKHLWSVPSTSTSKVAYHWLPPAGIISDEEISDILPILARSKKEVRDDKNRDDVGKSEKTDYVWFVLAGETSSDLGLLR
jgi:hypothetical protein